MDLIDAGAGRRLERFGERIVDRPAPTAAGERLAPAAWRRADMRFDRVTGWSGRLVTGPDTWSLEVDALRVELRATETGQVGIFPEQRPTWAFIREQVGAAGGGDVLNLFAYTGLASLAAAAAGASVVHVDAARPAVAWARRNAALSGLEGRPIRWLVDDAEAFLRREQRRGRRYHGIVLDPPSYGHGPRGGRWQLDQRLPELLRLVAAVAAPGAFVAVSAHTPGIGPSVLGDALRHAFGASAAGQVRVETGDHALDAGSGARLPLGGWARIMTR